MSSRADQASLEQRIAALEHAWGTLPNLENAIKNIGHRTAILEDALPEDQIANELFFIAANGSTGGGSAPSGPAGGVLTGTYPNPGLGTEVVIASNIKPEKEKLELTAKAVSSGAVPCELVRIGPVVVLRGMLKAEAEWKENETFATVPAGWRPVISLLGISIFGKAAMAENEAGITEKKVNISAATGAMSLTANMAGETYRFATGTLAAGAFLPLMWSRV